MAGMELGIQIMAGYGMSETCPVISVANLKPSMKHYDNEQKSDIVIKTGMPLTLVDVRIVDPMGNFLPNDGQTTGEIVVRAPGLPKGITRIRKSRKNSGVAAGCIRAMWAIWIQKGISRLRPAQGCH